MPKLKKDAEIGIAKSASKAAKTLDNKLDKASGAKEGSPADLKMDRKINKADRAGRLKNIQSY